MTGRRDEAREPTIADVERRVEGWINTYPAGTGLALSTWIAQRMADAANKARFAPDEDVKLVELRELLAKATKGPWSFDGPRDSIIIWGPDPDIRVCFMTSDGPARENAALIVAAVNALPDLLARISQIPTLIEEERARAIEEAARVADGLVAMFAKADRGEVARIASDAAQDIADAIRALVSRSEPR